MTAVELRFERPGLFNVDGEILEHDGLLRLRVLPGMMEMLVRSPELCLTWLSIVGERSLSKELALTVGSRRYMMLYIYM